MQNRIDRRDFLKLGATTALSLSLPQALIAESSGVSFSDYKAIVILDMSGGNDSFSMFPPIKKGANVKNGYSVYSNARGPLAIKDNDMMGELKKHIKNGQVDFSAIKGKNNFYYSSDNMKMYTMGHYKVSKLGDVAGINGLMPEIAHLIENSKGALVHNVGNLGEPVTKNEMRIDKSKRPPQLFSHSSQHALLNNGIAGSESSNTGWLGRLADEWGSINGSSVYPLNINLSPFGTSKMMFGNDTQALNIGYKGPTKIADYDKQKDIINRLLQSSSTGRFSRLYKDIRESFFSQTDKILSDWADADSNKPFAGLKDVYGEDLFSGSGNIGFSGGGGILELIKHFEAVSKLIWIGKNSGISREVFYVKMGGYDSHTVLGSGHPVAMRMVSFSIDSFFRAMRHLGLEDKVVVAPVSEFSRSLSSNGTGTDHAWAGTYGVFGGAVKPGNYGEIPDLTLGGEYDFDRRGRFIPTISFSQHLATIIKWFGADDATLDRVFPELKNFTEKDLGFLRNT